MFSVWFSVGPAWTISDLETVGMFEHQSQPTKYILLYYKNKYINSEPAIIFGELCISPQLYCKHGRRIQCNFLQSFFSRLNTLYKFISVLNRFICLWCNPTVKFSLIVQEVLQKVTVVQNTVTKCTNLFQNVPLFKQVFNFEQ